MTRETRRNRGAYRHREPAETAEGRRDRSRGGRHRGCRGDRGGCRRGGTGTRRSCRNSTPLRPVEDQDGAPAPRPRITVVSLSPLLPMFAGSPAARNCPAWMTSWLPHAKIKRCPTGKTACSCGRYAQIKLPYPKELVASGANDQRSSTMRPIRRNCAHQRHEWPGRRRRLVCPVGNAVRPGAAAGRSECRADRPARHCGQAWRYPRTTEGADFATIWAGNVGLI